MPQMSRSQILSNTLYHIEYSSDYTGCSAVYPTFSIAYLVYSTSHWPTLDSWTCRPHGGRRMITKFIPKKRDRRVEDAASRTTNWGDSFPRTSYWGLDMTESVPEKGNKSKSAEEDIHPNQGQQKKSETWWRKMQDPKWRQKGYPDK